MKKEVKHNIHISIITIVIIAALYYTINPAFTGFVVLGGSNFTASNLSTFNYDSEKIVISDGVISLKGAENTYNWTTYSQEEFQLTGAFYSSSDKLSEVSTQNGNTFEINEDKISNFIFEDYLNNGDLITLYLKEKEPTNIYACLPNEECNSTNLGLLYFPD